MFKLNHLSRSLSTAYIFAGLALSALGQGQTSPCGADAYHDLLMQSPGYAAMVQQIEAAYQNAMSPNGPQAVGGGGGN